MTNRSDVLQAIRMMQKLKWIESEVVSDIEDGDVSRDAGTEVEEVTAVVQELKWRGR